MEKHRKIVNRMMSGDKLSQWLGIEILSTTAGGCEVKMTVRDEMVNGFSVAHGGITYSLADSALAFASNSHGPKCMSIETGISHTRKVYAGDILIANARELSCSRKIGVYDVTVTNQKSEVVALFKGTVFRSGEEWEV